jgi:hypothetical protein
MWLPATIAAVALVFLAPGIAALTSGFPKRSCASNLALQRQK